MGGIGSGNRCQWSSTLTFEATRRISVAMFPKGEEFAKGYSGTFHWTCAGQPSGWVRYDIYECGFRLRFRVRHNGGLWESVTQRIRFAETRCNFGGTRKWLICPGCGRRTTCLAGAGKLFLCRKCYGLPYGSQHETKVDRLNRKIRKRRARIGASTDLFEPIFAKPKGMHHKTFRRLVSDDERLRRELDRSFFFGMPLTQ